MYDLHIYSFPPFSGLPFHFPDGVLCRMWVFNVYEVYRINLLPLVSYLRNHCLHPVMKFYKSAFSSESYHFNSYPQFCDFLSDDLNSTLVNSSVQYEVGVQVHSLTGGYPLLPAPFAEITVLFLLNCVGPFVKKLTINIWVYIQNLKYIPIQMICLSLCQYHTS